MQLKGLNFLFYRLCPILWVAISFATLLSCNKITYLSQGGQNELVILAEITAGDTANIPIGTSIPAGTGSMITFTKLNSANAFISGQNFNGQPLSLNQSADFLSNPMAVYSGGSVFQNNNLYKITASASGFSEASAQTSIPNDFTVSEVKAETDDQNGKPVLRFQFTIVDAGNEKNYYEFEALKQLVRMSQSFTWQGVKYDYGTEQGYSLYQQVKGLNGVSLQPDTILSNQYLRLPVYTSDSKTDNSLIGSLDSPFTRIFIRDSLFNGRKYQSQILIDRTLFKATDSAQLGIVQVQIKSLSKELYDYLLQTEKYESDFGNFPVSSLISPVGNISHGLGIFGGSVRKQWSYYYDLLP